MRSALSSTQEEGGREVLSQKTGEEEAISLRMSACEHSCCV
jgi:hypothetical protein